VWATFDRSQILVHCIDNSAHNALTGTQPDGDKGESRITCVIVLEMDTISPK